MRCLSIQALLLLSVVGLSAAIGHADNPKNDDQSKAPAAKPSPHEAEIRELIDKLAISEKVATEEPVLTPSKNTPATDKRVIAFAAAAKLRAFGAEAFPYLLDALDDKRQSVGFRRVLPSTVGDACFCVIEEHLYALPKDYRGSFYRQGKDGKNHERPVFLKELFSPATIRDWLEERRGRRLEELQLEALGWVLDEEEKIGAATPGDQKNFLRPLRTKYAELTKQVEEKKQN